METSSYSKDLSFKDAVSKQVLFRSAPNKHLDRLLDANENTPVKISINPNIESVYYVHRPDADSEKDELMQIYIKQGLTTVKSYLDMDLSVDFTDMATGKRCKIGIKGEWRARTAMLWLDRRDGQTQFPIGKVYRTKMRNGFNVDIAPNVDTSLMLLICALIDDDLKRLRRYQNGLGHWGLVFGI